MKRCHELEAKRKEQKTQREIEQRRALIREQIDLEAQERNRYAKCKVITHHLHFHRIEGAKRAEETQMSSKLDEWAKDNGRCAKASETKNDDSETSQAVRKGGKISVKFSERKFPHAKRESKLEEEERFWAQQKRMMNERKKSRTLPESSETVTESESASELKEMGDRFMRIGQTESAVNAYSKGLLMDSRVVALWVNRSIAFLKLGSFDGTITSQSKKKRVL